MKFYYSPFDGLVDFKNVVYFLLLTVLVACTNGNHKQERKVFQKASQCLKSHQNCEDIYTLDTTFQNTLQNILYALWIERTGNIEKAMEVWDQLEQSLAVEPLTSYWKQKVLINHLALKQKYASIDIDSLNDLILEAQSWSKPTPFLINLLQVKSNWLREAQDINFAFATSLYAEYLTSHLAEEDSSELYFVPWSVHAINLIREMAPDDIIQYHLEKAMKGLDRNGSDYRWLKTLSLTVNHKLSRSEIQAVKELVIDSSLVMIPTVDRIDTQLGYSGDDDFTIEMLTQKIQQDNLLPCTGIGYYNFLYLVDAFIHTNQIDRADQILEQLFSCEIPDNDIWHYLRLYRKQQLFYQQYLKDQSLQRLQLLMQVNRQLLKVYDDVSGVINEHYADAIYQSNNILVETLYEALKYPSWMSSKAWLNALSDIKVLYDMISDTHSILKGKKADGEKLKRINKLKFEIEKRELMVGRYLDTVFLDMKIFEPLYELHQDLYLLRDGLENKDEGGMDVHESIDLSDVSDRVQILDIIKTDQFYFLSSITKDGVEMYKFPSAETDSCILILLDRIIKKEDVSDVEYCLQQWIDKIDADKDHLIIVPDGRFYDFPIEMLPIYQGGPSLMESLTISYLPHLRHLKNLDSLTIQPSLNIWSYSDERTLRDRTPKSYPELPLGYEECKRIASQYEEVLWHAGEELKDLSFDQMNDHSVIHISTHAQSSTYNPLDNYILTRDHQGHGVPLYGFHIKQYRFDKTLVILSSCNSGTGVQKPGTGVFSLSRDFLQAGAETVIKSLWAVNETSTALIMEHFHQFFLRGHDASEALRLAKLQLKSSDRFSHPYYWSGFILEGNHLIGLNDQGK